ncbi:MAG: VOC family protein [Acidimicrobiia bacterium]|nr:VOC family protein [Acidimicrobiia bacterium]
MSRDGTEPFALEHVNLTVGDLQDSIRFLTTAFPGLRVRGRSPIGVSPAWAHLGTDTQYLALSEATADRPPGTPGAPGFKHVGFEVRDAEALRTRMLAAGFREGYIAPGHPHRRRVYFLDADGNEFEFVEYFSRDPAERNAYEP